LDIQFQLARKISDNRMNVVKLAPNLLVLVKRIVHFPKVSLQIGCRCRVSSIQRVLVNLRKRQMVEVESYTPSELTLQSLQDWEGQTTGWALVIAVLVNCDHGLGHANSGSRQWAVIRHG